MPKGAIGKTPINGGSWQGGIANRGEGIWDSTNSDIRTLDGDLRYNGQTPDSVSIAYHRNYPNFFPWMQFPANLNGFPGYLVLPFQTGGRTTTINGRVEYYDNDSFRADNELAVQLGWRDVNNQPDFRRVLNMRKDSRRQVGLPELSWHHHEDMKTMLLIPSFINYLGHDGGAKWAKSARW